MAYGSFKVYKQLSTKLVCCNVPREVKNIKHDRYFPQGREVSQRVSLVCGRLNAFPTLSYIVFKLKRSWNKPLFC